MLSTVTQNLTWTVCQYPLSNEVPKTKVVRMVLFAVLPTLSIILRIVVKVARLSTWGWDDYSILLAYVGVHIKKLAHATDTNLAT